MPPETRRIFHTIPPVYNAKSEILILGTMPSPKSREAGFYYWHPQNRFWRVMADVFGEVIPATATARTDFLLRRHIALWDVLASCTIKNADDSSISNAVPNDLSLIFQAADIRAVFTTGKKAGTLYNKYFGVAGIPSVCLPSTSPANCRTPYDKLLTAYGVILQYSSHGLQLN